MRDRFYLVLIVLLSLLPLISVFSTNLLPHTHDGLVHIPRMGAFYKALLDGQFPVRWAGELNYGYGMPLFNFMYQLPYLIASLFLTIGFGLVQSFKITLSLSYVLSGIFMFLFARELFKNNKHAFFVAVFYQFFPFRLVELLVRGSFGEVYTYTFLPLVLYGVLKLVNTKSKWSFILISIAIALLVLAHNSVSLLFFAVIVGFIYFFVQKKADKIRSVVAVGFGLMLSMYYWFPAITDHRYTYGNLHMKNLYQEHFAPLLHFFIPNLTNDSSLQIGGITIFLGITQCIAIIAALFVIKNKKLDSLHKKIFLFSLILLMISFFFMQPVSQILWENISYLRQFQFPWRFLALCGLATSLLSVSILYKTKNNFFYWLILIVTVFSTVYYWKPGLGYDTVKEEYYWNFPLNTTYYGETDIIWSAGPAKKYAKSPVEFVSGKGSISDIHKNSYVHTFTVNAGVDSVVVDNTQYFPGWKAFVDGHQVPVQFQDENWRGLITFPVSKGTHFVEVRFTETKTRMVANGVSLATLFSLIVLACIKRKYL